jgi:hypothetical protein
VDFFVRLSCRAWVFILRGITASWSLDRFATSSRGSPDKNVAVQSLTGTWNFFDAPPIREDCSCILFNCRDCLASVLQVQAFFVFLAGLGRPRTAEGRTRRSGKFLKRRVSSLCSRIKIRQSITLRTARAFAQVRFEFSIRGLSRTHHPIQRGESKAVTFSFLIWAYSVFCNDLMKNDRALLRGQIFFNLADQLGNIDRFGERWMPLDAEPSLSLRFRD